MVDVTGVERKRDKKPNDEAGPGVPFYFQTKAPVDTATGCTCLPGSCSMLRATWS